MLPPTGQRRGDRAPPRALRRSSPSSRPCAPVDARARRDRRRAGARGRSCRGDASMRAARSRRALAVRGRATPRAHCVLAPNPWPMTLDGTNTWVLLEPGSTEAVVIDPGPLDEGHLAARPARVAGAGRAGRARRCSPTGTPTTPRRAPRFAELTGAPGARGRRAATTTCGDGDVLTAGWPRAARGRGTPGPHVRLASRFALPGGPRPAHRRHRARPRHHGGRAPRRRARGLPRLAGRGSRALTGDGGWPRSCPGTGRWCRTPRRWSRSTAPTGAERLDQVRDGARRGRRDGRRGRGGTRLCRRAPRGVAGGRAGGARPAGVPDGRLSAPRRLSRSTSMQQHGPGLEAQPAARARSRRGPC